MLIIFKCYGKRNHQKWEKCYGMKFRTYIDQNIETDLNPKQTRNILPLRLKWNSCFYYMNAYFKKISKQKLPNYQNRELV